MSMERKVSRHLESAHPLDPGHVLYRWWLTVRWLDATWLAALGVTLLGGGRTRMGGPSLHGLIVASDRYHFDARWWAVPPILAGLLLGFGILRDAVWLRLIAFILGALFSFTFALGGLLAIPRNPTASATAVPTYLFTGLLQLTLIYASVQVAVLRRSGR